MSWKFSFTATAVCFLLQFGQIWAEFPAVTIVSLPPLRLNGQSARAHTQGLEIVDGKYYVTARRDDVKPMRALLLKTDLTRLEWDSWDITPVDADGNASTLDHPGGIQSDGRRLWVPVAESRRNSRSRICVFALKELVPGRPAKAEFEFEVQDHVGAVAVSKEQKRVFGASWDTEIVYVWDLFGRLQQTLTGAALQRRMLGVSTDSDSRVGVTIQDWKWIDNRLLASGLWKDPKSPTLSPASRLLIFNRFLDSSFQQETIVLPVQSHGELAKEAMAVSQGVVHFLLEDLGASNRVFRISLSKLAKLGTKEAPTGIRR